MAPPADPYEHRSRHHRPDDRRHGRSLLGLGFGVWLVLVLLLAAVFVAIVIAES